MLAVKVVVVGMILAMCPADPASANTIGRTYITNDGISAQASASGAAPSVNAGRDNAAQPVCTYQVIPNSPESVLATPNGPTPIYDSTHSSTNGSWQFQQCIDATGNQTLVTIWIPKANPAALAQQSISEQSLPEPEISTSPPLPSGAVVNFPTWLWINNAAWHPVSATAAVAGLTVTATATPVSVVWTMGDGKSVTCNGPGVAYDQTKPDGEQRSGCTYTYEASSAKQPNHTYSVTASVQWNTTWQATDGTNGQLGVITRSTTIAVPVREIQAVNVAPAGGW